MDLIVTDAGHIDRAVIEDYALDAAWGADENDFELTVDRMLEPGSYVYADGSELGGVIDSLRDRLERGGSTLTYGGRTWHGILANKILAPDTGQNYLVVSGKASTVIGMIVNRVVDPSMNDLVKLDGVDVLAYIPTDPIHAANDIHGKSVFELPEDSNIMVGVHQALHNLGIF